ncbi:unnamed protein product [Schistocephalus solidus]|uniref:Expressed conserved protein n=1 Tax=Schistocephalus solidus TaxID=70667 RepID=A0A183TTG1_SCHSO|nr:unnamed protein product [Schistocephalus solidus]
MGDLQGNPYGFNYDDLLISMISGAEEDFRHFDYDDGGSIDGEDWEDQTGRWHSQPYASLSSSWWEDLCPFAQNIILQVLPNMLFSLTVCLLWRISFLVLTRCPSERGVGDPQHSKRRRKNWGG